MTQPDPILHPTPLDERVTSLGQSWVDEVRETLQRDGRRPSGMWPGTLSEARALSTRAFGSGGPPPTHEERERVAHELYAVARRCWLSSREPEEADLEGDDEMQGPSLVSSRR